MLEIAINQFITYTAISLTSISIRLVMCSTALQKITKGMTNRTITNCNYLSHSHCCHWISIADIIMWFVQCPSVCLFCKITMLAL